LKRARRAGRKLAALEKLEENRSRERQPQRAVKAPHLRTVAEKYTYPPPRPLSPAEQEKLDAILDEATRATPLEPPDSSSTPRKP